MNFFFKIFLTKTIKTICLKSHELVVLVLHIYCIFVHKFRYHWGSVRN